MERLPATVIIDARPRDGRPAIIELPIERTHAERHVPAMRFEGDAETVGLEHLGEIAEMLKAPRKPEMLDDETVDDGFAARMFLVIGKWWRVAMTGAVRREPLDG